MAVEQSVTGGCLCGAIRFEATVEQVRKMRDDDRKPISEIARAFKVNRSTIYRL